MNVTFTVFYSSLSHRAPAFSQSFTASKGTVTKVDLPIALRASTTSLANFDISVNVKAEDGKTIVVYLLNEDRASTDIALLYPKFATKTKCIHTMHTVVFDPYLNLVLTKECCQCNKILYDGHILPSDVSLIDIVCTGGEVCGCAAQFHPSVGFGSHMLTHTQDSCSMGATLYAFQDQNSYGSL